MEFPHIEDKIRFLEECITELEKQLRLREEQREQFLLEIEEKVLDIRNEMYRLGDPIPQTPLRTALEHEIKNLERERRSTEVEFWRDVNELRRDLRQLKKEYRSVRAGAIWSKK